MRRVHNTLHMTVGLPRAGKSTWALNRGWPIVCPDDVRCAIHGSPYIEEAEPLVWATVGIMVRALFGAGHRDVILCSTNTTRERRDAWKGKRHLRKMYIFPATPVVCKSRIFLPDPLGEVIDRMAEKYQPPTLDELVEGEEILFIEQSTEEERLAYTQWLAQRST